MFAQVTYIWMDGAQLTQKLRSKVRIIKHPERDITLVDFPEWGFDSSSTYQATGKDSDLILQPVHFVKDPILDDGNYLVLCKVMNPDGSHILQTPPPACVKSWPMELLNMTHGFGLSKNTLSFKASNLSDGPIEDIPLLKALFIAASGPMKYLAGRGPPLSLNGRTCHGLY